MELNPSKPRTSESTRDFLVELAMDLLSQDGPLDEREEKDDRDLNRPVTEAELKERLLSVLRPKHAPSQRLVIKCGPRMLFLHPEKIEWVEAEKDYVRLQQVRMKGAFVALAHPPGHAPAAIF